MVGRCENMEGEKDTRRDGRGKGEAALTADCQWFI
jgi:hypothetical protein